MRSRVTRKTRATVRSGAPRSVVAANSASAPSVPCPSVRLTMQVNNCTASTGSSTPRAVVVVWRCRPVARRVVTGTRPPGTRSGNGPMSAGASTLSGTTSHPSRPASQAMARSVCDSAGNPASPGCRARTCRPRPVRARPGPCPRPSRRTLLPALRVHRRARRIPLSWGCSTRPVLRRLPVSVRTPRRAARTGAWIATGLTRSRPAALDPAVAETLGAAAGAPASADPFRRRHHLTGRAARSDRSCPGSPRSIHPTRRRSSVPSGTTPPPHRRPPGRPNAPSANPSWPHARPGDMIKSRQPQRGRDRPGTTTQEVRTSVSARGDTRGIRPTGVSAETSTGRPPSGNMTSVPRPT